MRRGAGVRGGLQARDAFAVMGRPDHPALIERPRDWGWGGSSHELRERRVRLSAIVSLGASLLTVG